jgi:hypothetical protein
VKQGNCLVPLKSLTVVPAAASHPQPPLGLLMALCAIGAENPAPRSTLGQGKGMPTG